MADLPRLNNIIRALEAGQHALTCFAPAHVDSAIAMSASKYDGCVFEMEHNPWDGRALRDFIQLGKCEDHSDQLFPASYAPLLTNSWNLRMNCARFTASAYL